MVVLSRAGKDVRRWGPSGEGGHGAVLLNGVSDPGLFFLLSSHSEVSGSLLTYPPAVVFCLTTGLEAAQLSLCKLQL